MRAPLALAALAALSLGSLAPAAESRADPAHQLVVCLRRDPDPRATRPEHDSAPAARLAAHGLRLVRPLAVALPAAPARRDPSVSPAPESPFADLDPARIWLVEAPDERSAVLALRTLASDPALEWVEPNPARAPAWIAGSGNDAIPDDPFLRDSRQWGLRNLGPAGVYGGVAGADIGALDAWRLSRGSDAVRLAIADTGIDPAHPELDGTLPGGGARIELGRNVTGEPWAAIADSFAHGTAVAGVMAARTGEGAHFDSLGVAGVCGGDGGANPGCRIVPIRITRGSEGAATAFDIAAAILYATAVGARALNLSFAGNAPSRLEREALRHAITRGCVVVAASGNRGDRRPQYPAAYAADGLCIAVGATDPWDRRAAFASHGPGLDVLAPGLQIWTTYPTYPSARGVRRNGYVPASGTSFAAPFVTGTLGLIAAVRPELTDVDLQHVIRGSAADLGAPGPDPETGWGRLDAAAALRAVDGSQGVWHDEVGADRLREVARDTLSVSEGAPGAPGPLLLAATAIEASATVALPDSFLEPVRIWPRIAGTTTVRGGFELPYFTPWAEVLGAGARSFELRGWLYGSAGPGEARDLPVPLDQARFGFTVIGRVDRPPSLEALAPAPDRTVATGDSLVVSWLASDPDEVTEVEVWLEREAVPPLLLARVPGHRSSAIARIPCGATPRAGQITLVALDLRGPRRDRTAIGIPIRLRAGDCDPAAAAAAPAAAPNPFRGATRLTGPPGAHLSVIDVSGRRVRRARLDGRLGAFDWDGRDDGGRALAPGFYLVRCESVRGTTQTKVLKLD